MAAKITVAGRADYGARPPRRPLTRFPSAPAGEVFLHHTVTPTYGTDWRRAALKVQEVAFDRGFTDTSYPVLVHPPTGTVIEGRGPQWIGAHTLHHNSRAQAVSIIGNYETGPLSNLGVAAIRYAIALLVSGGHLRAGVKIAPHRAVYPTACPGRFAVARLGEIRVPWRPTAPTIPDLSALLEDPMTTILHGTDSSGDATYVLREGEDPVPVSVALARASKVLDVIGSPEVRAGKGTTNQLLNNARKAAN